MGVGYASEHLGKRSPNTLGAFAPQKTPLVGIVPKQANCHLRGLTHSGPFHTNPTRQRGSPQVLAAKRENPRWRVGLVFYGGPRKLELTVNAQDHEVGTMPHGCA